MEAFREVSAYELENAMKLIGKDWMLITAEDKDNKRVNAMTASWGFLGVLWHKCVCTVFIRPQRHTYSLIEGEDRFTVAFMDEEYRAALTLCGKESGRDGDKLKKAGLSTDLCDGVPYIKEARLVLVCRKLYADDLKENAFADKSLLSNYAAGDFHRMYICEIEKAYVR